MPDIMVGFLLGIPVGVFLGILILAVLNANGGD